MQHFGFEFDQRGLILVKGKGKLMTYYLTGRQQKTPQSQAPVSHSKSHVASLNQSASVVIHSSQSAVGLDSNNAGTVVVQVDHQTGPKTCLNLVNEQLYV